MTTPAARDDLANLIAQAIATSYEGLADAIEDEVELEILSVGMEHVSFDCGPIADAIIAAGWHQ